MHAYLPITWASGQKPSDGSGGPPAADAGAVYVVLDDKDDFLPDQDEGTVLMRGSIGALVADFVETTSEFDAERNPTIATECVASAQQLRAALVDAIRVIDAALPKAEAAGAAPAA